MPASWAGSSRAAGRQRGGMLSAKPAALRVRTPAWRWDSAGLFPPSTFEKKKKEKLQPYARRLWSPHPSVFLTAKQTTRILVTTLISSCYAIPRHVPPAQVDGEVRPARQSPAGVGQPAWRACVRGCLQLPPAPEGKLDFRYPALNSGRRSSLYGCTRCPGPRLVGNNSWHPYVASRRVGGGLAEGLARLGHAPDGGRAADF